MDIIDTMARQEKICKYLDIPLQHASDSVLQTMKRQINQAETKELIYKIREKIPEISLRTTMLVGFPTETEEAFEELCSFVQEMKFDRLGVFQYSHEEDTSAYIIEDFISPEIKEERAQLLMELQQEISSSLNQKKIGKIFKAIIDRVEGPYFIGRTYADSPEVDNEVLIAKENNYIQIGDFVQVEITDASEFDLYGKLL